MADGRETPTTRRNKTWVSAGHTHRLAVLLVFGVLLCLLASVTSIVYQPTDVVVHKTPSVLPTSKIYRVYLPMIVNRACRPNQKRGLAHTWGKCQDVAGVCAVWQHQWYIYPTRCDGVENVAMVRDAAQQARLRSSPGGWLGDLPWLMGYNEPDMCPDQACLTVEQAVPLWRELETMFPERRLVAPAPSHVHPEWIVQFRAEYLRQYNTPPRFDALAMHWYGQRAQYGIAMAEWYKARAREWNVPEVWVTEFAVFACTNLSLAEAGAEARTLIEYFDSDPLITRYAWFTNRTRADENYVGAYMECSAYPLFDWATGKPTFWRDVYTR